jgi:hypothetical protein
MAAQRPPGVRVMPDLRDGGGWPAGAAAANW